MKKTIDKIAILLLMAFAVACVDEEKDPVKFDKIAKGTFLALRGDAFNALNATGCSNSFFKNNLIGNEVYSVDADFLSEDQESLQEVQLYASVLTTTKGGLSARARKLVATVPGSAFTFPSGSTVKRGNFSVTLAKVMTELNISADSLVKLNKNADGDPTADITMDVDLVLKDGSKVLAADIVNPNLFQSVVFYPAMVLTYCANDQDDFVPVATTKMQGEYSKNATTGVVTRTVVPLKNGVSDTLLITYDNPIITAPSVSFSPSTAGTSGAVTKYKATDNVFYVIYTAGGTVTYTGAVTATVTGATAEVAGVVLTQNAKTQTINVDNTPPQITANVGDFLLGKGQFITLKVTYNEVMSRKSADAIKATITGQGLEAVTATTMPLATDGLSASLIYIFKLADPLVAATHGNLTVTFTGGKDAAGNAAPAPSGSITVDVNAPPAPTLTLNGGGHDLGTQIKWSANETRDNTPVTGNPNGDQTGKVYFIAITSGKPGPTAVSFDADGVATWTMPEDPASATDPKAKVAIRQSGIVSITNTNGNSANPTFTPFTANGTLDIYAVFLGNTGNKSVITVTPQLTGVVMN